MDWHSRLCAALGVAALLSCSKQGDDSAGKIQAALSAADKKLPATLAETQLFLGGSPLSPVLTLQPFDVKVPLWSDGAQKRRYIFVPPGESLKFDAASHSFTYPIGTTLAKHFASGGDLYRPVETRVMTLKSDGKWAFGTYVWQDDGTTKLNERPGKVVKDGVEWRIPSEKECHYCHGDPGAPLGFVPRQLNIGGADGSSQIDALASLAIFADELETLKAVATLDDPTDATLTVEQRARSYMEVNCGSCHNPRGPDKATNIDLRLATVDTRLVSEGDIVPGNPGASKMWELLNNVTERMPNLNLRPDAEGLELMRQYIEQLPK